MQFRRQFLCVVLASVVSSCGSPSDAGGSKMDEVMSWGVATKMKLNEGLKDPDTAEFRNVVVYNVRMNDGSKGYAFCGEVNAKNGFGGYSGYQRFVGNPAVVALESESAGEFQSLWNDYCDPLRKEEDARWF